MLTTIELYACYAVKLYKNKPEQISQTGGARSAPILDPPLCYMYTCMTYL